MHLGQATVPEGPIEVQKWLGSGFLVDQDCTIVTADHVIQDPLRLVAKFVLPGRRDRARTARVEVLSRDPVRDIAFVRLVLPKCHFGSIRPLPLASAFERGALDGASIVVVGFGSGKNSDYPSFRRGIISNSELAHGDEPMLTLELNGESGFSGGPVVLETSGVVVGVFSSHLTEDRTVSRAFPITQLDYELATRSNVQLPDVGSGP